MEQKVQEKKEEQATPPQGFVTVTLETAEVFT